MGINETTSEENIEIKGENGAFFDPEIVNYSEEAILGDDVWIAYSVTNTGEATGTQDINLTVEIEEVDFKREVTLEEDLTLEPEENCTNEYSYDTSEVEEEPEEDIVEKEVEANITVETEDASDSERSTITSPGLITSPELIPGFTFTLLVMGMTFAVIIYHTKKR